MNPILSICVPTYNRADWVRFTLPLWVEQVRGFGEECEVVVSDNCSEDETESVARQFLPGGNLRYHRNPTNIGGHPNFFLLVSELARGQFVWLVGDDDFPVPGAVEQVMAAIRAHPDLPYLYANYRTWQEAVAPSAALDVNQLLEAATSTGPDRVPGRLSQLREIAGLDMNSFSSISCSIFRREHAVAAFEGSLHEPNFTTVRSSSSHALYVAEQLLPLPAFDSGVPWLILSTDSTWETSHPIFALRTLPALIDALAANGAPTANIEKSRRKLLRQSWPPLGRMLLGRRTRHRELFSVRKFVSRNMRYPEFWPVLFKAVLLSLWLRIPPEWRQRLRPARGR